MEVVLVLVPLFVVVAIVAIAKEPGRPAIYFAHAYLSRTVSPQHARAPYWVPSLFRRRFSVW